MTRVSQAELVSNVAESTGTPTSTVKAAISTFIDQVQMNVKKGNWVFVKMAHFVKGERLSQAGRHGQPGVHCQK